MGGGRSKEGNRPWTRLFSSPKLSGPLVLFCPSKTVKNRKTGVKTMKRTKSPAISEGSVKKEEREREQQGHEKEKERERERGDSIRLMSVNVEWEKEEDASQNEVIRSY
ncbi:hypothetical protein RUM44_002079 [Polyplax serrata]|uniref:Uncharacterized protein n=1 Tax=Polyplax serrata TaxID=468196 RepID=A0ABR1ALW4_POLSC